MSRPRAIVGLFLAGLLSLATVAAAEPGGAPAGSFGPAEHHEVHTVLPSVPSERPALVSGEVDTARFRILFTKGSEGSARALAERIEAVRDDFQKVLGRDWPGITEIRMGLGRDEMNALALPGGTPPAWAEALAYPGRNIILLDAHSLLKPDGEITLRHELSHAALGQIAQGWPAWFQEGMAMYLTGDRFSVAQYTAMFRAVTQDRLFHFKTLSEDWPQHPQDVEIAYAESVAFVSHLVGDYGPDKMSALLDDVQQGAPFELAFARAFRTSLDVEEDAWRKTLPSRYSWTPIVTGGSALWLVISLLTVAAWLRRRRQHAIAMAELAAQEAAEDAAERLTRAAQGLPPADQAPAEISWPGFPVESGSDPEPESEPAEADPGFSSAFEDETGADENPESNSDDDVDEDGIPRRRVLH